MPTPTKRTPTTSRSEAFELLQTDHEFLFETIRGLSENQLHQEHRLAEGPLGHFCDSLHDLMAHILMWDEITLAVLREAAAGRLHWSLDPRWETVDAGRALNLGGVQAGRHLPSTLVEHRLRRVLEALLSEVQRYDEETWTGRRIDIGFVGSIGALAQYAATPPDGAPYGHVARHLGSPSARPRATR